jgi:hypothetical protein
VSTSLNRKNPLCKTVPNSSHKVMIHVTPSLERYARSLAEIADISETKELLIAECDKVLIDQISLLFRHAIDDEENVCHFADYAVDLMNGNDQGIVFGFRSSLGNVTLHFLKKMKVAMKKKNNSYDHLLRNFTSLFCHLFVNKVYQLEDFRIYCSQFRHDAVAYGREHLMVKLLDAIEPRLVDMKLCKKKFSEILDIERQNPKLLYELGDDNLAYNFDPQSYVKLNILQEAKTVHEQFKDFLKNPTSNFDLQLVSKSHLHTIYECALTCCSHVIQFDNHDDLAKIVERIFINARCSIGTLMNRNGNSVFCNTINKFLVTRAGLTLDSVKAIESFKRALESVNIQPVKQSDGSVIYLPIDIRWDF